MSNNVQLAVRELPNDLVDLGIVEPFLIQEVLIKIIGR
jgi:hypothetical protein